MSKAQIQTIRNAYDRYIEVRHALRHGQATLQQLAKALNQLDEIVAAFGVDKQ